MPLSGGLNLALLGLWVILLLSFYIRCTCGLGGGLRRSTKCGGKYPNDHKINHRWQPQFHELLHHHLAERFEIFRGESIVAILPKIILISSGTSFSLDHCLNSLRHALNQVIPLMVIKLIPNINDYLLHRFQRGNMIILL